MGDIMAKSVNELAGTLKSILRSRGFNITDSSDDQTTLIYEVERAIAEVNKCRRFDPTKDNLYDSKYESVIIPLCLCAFAKVGAEGQTSHSENGIVRNYTTGGDYPSDILNGIIPLAK